MKIVIYLCAILVVAQSKPQFFQNLQNAFINTFQFDTPEQGKYSYNVETSDNFKKQETGYIKNAGTSNEILVVVGSYSYIGPDGQLYEVRYIADENGFQPQGAHIPPAADTGRGPKTGIGSKAIGTLGGGL